MEEECRCEAPIKGYENIGKKSSVSKQEFLRNYEVGITFLSIGCIIRVGCKQIPFQNVADAMKALNAYVANPIEESERWNKVFNEI